MPQLLTSTRANLRGRWLRTFGRGVTGTSTAAGDTSSLVDSALTKYPNSRWVGATLLLTSGTYSGSIRYVTAFAASTGTLTFTPVLAGNSGSGTTYELYKETTKEAMDDVIREAVLRTMAVCSLPYVNESLQLFDDVYRYPIPQEYSFTGVAADADSTITHLQDAALAQTADFWNGAILVITSGSADGDVRIVLDYDEQNKFFVPDKAFSAAIAASDTYDIHRFYPETIHKLQYRTLDSDEVSSTTTSAGATAAGLSTLIDSTLTSWPNDFWIGARVEITSGAEDGKYGTVTDFVASTGTITFRPDVATTVASGITYTLTFPRFGQWQDIPDAAWYIEHNSSGSVICFHNLEDSSVRSRVWSIKDTAQLRILGTRTSLIPDDDNDPIELPETLLTAWARYLFNLNQAATPGVDPLDHRSTSRLALEEISILEDRFRTGFPPNSRKT